MKSYVTVLIVIGSFLYLSFISSNNGKAGKTGSPGETTCNTATCHTGNTVNAPGGSIIISAPGLIGWQYNPGQTYTIEVTITRTGVNLYGIGFEALKSDGSNAGQLVITNTAQTQIKNAIVGINSRANVVHTLNGGASAGSHTFSFNWVAPGAGTGNITFYAAGNAANGTNTTAGDFIYTTSQVVVPSTTGLTELNANANFLVYPNPATSNLSVHFQCMDNGLVSGKLISLNGKLQHKLFSNQFTKGTQQMHIDLPSHLNRGVYFLVLEMDGSKLTKKISIL
jgi:hypothetical protein